jgi:hypothetical protein
MGIRGVDIQVAIQRAAEAEKIQQGETSQVRAGEAGVREEGEVERARRQEQPQKTERGDQVIIRGHKEQQRKEQENQRGAGEDETGEEDEAKDIRKRLKERGKLDILA